MTRPNFENRTLYHGDNLDFLRSINTETIDLIATDPPFNQGRDFHATPDSLADGATFQDRWRWKEDVHEPWIDQMQDDWPTVWAVVDLTERSGQAAQDVITDIEPLSTASVERQGYPTQKPLALYRRFIRASSDEGDVVLDPFCGCATTPIAAELEGRRWLGADLWDDAPNTVLKRLAEEVRLGNGARQANADMVGEWRGRVHLRTEPLVRTDDGEVAAPKLKTLRRTGDKPTMSRAKMIDALVEEHGMHCQGCGFAFPHRRYIELDHNLPRADGGKNDIENRVLLCGPCNRAKGHVLTLSGLRLENKRNGVMAEQLALDVSKTKGKRNDASGAVTLIVPAGSRTRVRPPTGSLF